MDFAVETAYLHPSTALCLEAMQRLQERVSFTNILDMGCGNGILSAVAATAWDAKVTAVDISEKAIADARSNIASHGLLQRINLLRSNGFTAPQIRQNMPYDLILFNMLAQDTIAMAGQVKSHLAEGGVVILAGILAWIGEDVKIAYGNLGFDIIEETSNSPWHCQVMRRQGGGPHPLLS